MFVTRQLPAAETGNSWMMQFFFSLMTLCAKSYSARHVLFSGVLLFAGLVKKLKLYGV